MSRPRKRHQTALLRSLTIRTIKAACSFTVHLKAELVRASRTACIHADGAVRVDCGAATEAHFGGGGVGRRRRSGCRRGPRRAAVCLLGRTPRLPEAPRSRPRHPGRLRDCGPQRRVPETIHRLGRVGSQRCGAHPHSQRAFIWPVTGEEHAHVLPAHNVISCSRRTT